MILLIRYLSGILGDLQELTQKEKVRVQTLHVHVATVQTEINCPLYYNHNIKLCMNPHLYDNDITYMYLLITRTI